MSEQMTMRRRAEFRPIRGGRAALMLIVVLLGLVLIPLGSIVYFSLTGDRQPDDLPLVFGLLPALVWLAALGWNVYWYGWRIPCEVTLEDGMLRWKLLFRNGQAPVTAFDTLTNRFGGLSVHLSGSEHQIDLLSVNGTALFIDELRRANPALPAAPPSRLRQVREAGTSRRSRTRVHEAVGYATR